MRVQCSHNAAENATTGFSPARLILGKELNLPEDLIAEEAKDKGPKMTRLNEREEEYQVAVEEARKNINAEQERRVEEAE